MKQIGDLVSSNPGISINTFYPILQFVVGNKKFLLLQIKKSRIRLPKTDDRGQRTEGGGQKTKDRGQMTDDGYCVWWFYNSKIRNPKSKIQILKWNNPAFTIKHSQLQTMSYQL
jgi:hypothetical protein